MFESTVQIVMRQNVAAACRLGLTKKKASSLTLDALQQQGT